MNSLRKWLYKPKRTDKSLLAQFYFADEELNSVAAELDSFDSRKDPERCQALVTQLRSCQDKVLTIIQRIMDEAIPYTRTTRDFRVKFPDDVVQENLAGQLWFGAECLAAGSSIMNREMESATMRPLARALTKNLDSLRCILRDQCLMSVNEYSERIQEALIIFDKLFAEFELSYVSAMVPVKSVKEYETIQEITVLFSETVIRAKKLGYITTDMIDEYDPALMFTIPRLAIVCGLLIYADGPLNPDSHSWNMSDMFRPFQTLLYKIRELLYTLSETELLTLERALCSQDEPAFLSTSPQNSSPPSSTTNTAAVQTDASPLLQKGKFGDIQSLSSADRSSEGIHSAADGLTAETRSEGASSQAGLLLESVSCGAICYYIESGSEQATCRPKCLNKCDSNDSGLHSDGVSNSDSQYTISSSDSQQLLGHSALSSPIQSPTTKTFPEDCIEQEEEADSHYQLCQSVPDHEKITSETEHQSAVDTSTDGGMVTAQDMSHNDNAHSEEVPECSIVSDVSQAVKDTVVESSSGVYHTSINAEVHRSAGAADVEEEEESFYSTSPGDSPKHQPHCNAIHTTPQTASDMTLSTSSTASTTQVHRPPSPCHCRDDPEKWLRRMPCRGCNVCRSFFENFCNATAEARQHDAQRRQTPSDCVEGNKKTREEDGTDRDDTTEKGTFEGDDDHKESGDKTGCDSNKNFDGCAEKVSGKSQTSGASDADVQGDTTTPESQTKESDCDASKTSDHASLQDLYGVLQAVQAVFISGLPSTSGFLLRDQASHASGSTGETSADITDSCLQPKRSSSCDKEKKVTCDDDSQNQKEGVGSTENQSSMEASASEGPGTSLETGGENPQDSSQSHCDRCTQTPHSAINNAQSSKIHHHHHHNHSRQHSTPPATSPPATPASTSSHTESSSCDTATNSAKNKTSQPSPAKPPQSQTSAIKNDKSENHRPYTSTSTQVQKMSKTKSRTGKTKCPASNTAARLKQYTDNWSDCSSSSDNKKGSGPERTHSSCVDGGASGSSGCEGSSSASDCEWDQESCSSSETSSYNSECHDDEEIALAVQAAELASRNHARARFRSSSDMIHRLFVCISGVADQLQTNFAGDLRNILRVVFNLNCSEPVVMEEEKTFRRNRRRRGRSFYQYHNGDVANSSNTRDPPAWIPDDQSTMCMSCKTPFTFVRRRHHCRNCGKIFCGRCSSNAVSLPHFGHTKPVRVCNRCFMFQVTPFTMQGQA